MKTSKLFVLLLALMMALSGCANNNGGTKEPVAGAASSTVAEEANSGSISASTAEEKNSNDAAPGEVTQENLKNYPVTSEESFSTEQKEDGLYITECSSEDSVIVVPSEVKGSTIVGIDDYAFAGDKMQGIVLPDSVTKIGYAAFSDCTSLKYVELGSGLKSVGSMAFNACESLETVRFPDGLETIDGALFVGCQKLKEIHIPATVESLPGGIGDPYGCPDIVVVTPAGSAAEKAAQEQGFPVENS